MHEKISIKDIANRVGTSTTTVSFVLNGRAKEKHISASITEKVLSVVAELGYQPNSIARSLRTGKTKIIGFLVDDISKPFFSGLASVIDQKASADGYKIIFSSTGNDKKRINEILSLFKERHVDGYIIATAEGLEEEIGELVNGKTPVVLFDRYLPDLKADYILTDNYLATQNAGQHLLDKGFSNIAFVTIDTQQQQMIDRLNGYSAAMEHAGKQQNVLKIKYTNSEDATESIKVFLEQNPDLDSVIFSTNYLTMDGLKLSRIGQEQLISSRAVISFDDFELLEFIKPSITAIEQPIQLLGEKIVKQLLKRLNPETKPTEYGIFRIQATLNVRQSTQTKQLLN
ncbi:LacI family DNA-binding transcriptional regulator [Pedobacter aquatilis]|uniref:LacI family DNA-binding transcriptional regulator n=1 Tax=Pedobacter aquatilis TaxID=351343 RepID=UPI0025B2EE0E|nr:LacI family DNA-binding transcriptional regulator [Pedobacter aquatilis]MDN3585939.1 LacI family DNA-binding transcriptional regulator [Pedobacter aquatilis]